MFTLLYCNSEFSNRESAMKSSTRARYGLRALLYLAEQDPEAITSVREISEQENVSPDYLEHLLYALKAAGLVESVRGASGGFRLAKPAEEISLKDIFLALDENTRPLWCLGEGEPCPRMGECRSRPIWDELGEIVEGFLSRTTLASAVSAFKQD
jgi:Rrf2 family iron-sulfur cluster assembly transcriptional regulator